MFLAKLHEQREHPDRENLQKCTAVPQEAGGFPQAKRGHSGQTVPIIMVHETHHSMKFDRNCAEYARDSEMEREVECSDQNIRAKKDVWRPGGSERHQLDH